MSLLHDKLKAIKTAIDSAFDFANPEAVREKAEADFKQAVADEIKGLTERIEAMEKLMASPVISVTHGGVTYVETNTGDPQVLADASVNAIPANVNPNGAPPAVDAGTDTPVASTQPA